MTSGAAKRRSRSSAPTATARSFDQASATAATTKHMLLGHVQTEDAASAVARRLRTAIGLGVLADGEKLPKELDLARQLGVTAFSLREALSTLRGEGLIVTRVGKNGGSYVAHPRASESMAGDELVRLSATELRDLGDWRAALTTYSVWLASRRDAVATGDRLLATVREMESARDSTQARRALGRFHVELSAGAQSMRLTRADLVAHEEFDWLVQVLLQEPEHRAAIAATMRELAGQVRSGEPAQIWTAGQRMVSYLVTELMRERLQLIASRSSEPRSAALLERADLAAEIRWRFERLTAQLTSMAREIAVVVSARPPAQALYADVARCVLPCLGELDELVYGLGYMADIDVVPEAPRWLEWWQRSSDGTFDRDFSHQLDPDRDDFYDYAAKSYMVLPRTTRQPSASGPYIDHGGVDDYVITVSVPVLSGDVFLGIMTADVRVAGLERAVSPWLARANGVCALFNAEGRVVVSNTVPDDLAAMDPAERDLLITEVGLFGWQVGESAKE